VQTKITPIFGLAANYAVQFKRMKKKHSTKWWCRLFFKKLNYKLQIFINAYIVKKIDVIVILQKLIKYNKQ